MSVRDWLRTKWPALVVGVFVVPVSLNLLFGLPYSIYVDRDLQLHGLPTTGTAIAEGQRQYKGGGWHRFVTITYVVDGERHAEEYGLENMKLGETVALRYAPAVPSHSTLDVPPSLPWDDHLVSRLLISWTLGALFAATWTALLLARPRRDDPAGAGP